MEYIVKWDIQLQADSPLEAAMLALEWIIDENSICRTFETKDENGLCHTVDLSNEYEDDVV